MQTTDSDDIARNTNQNINIHTFFITNTFINNSRLKLAKN